MEYILVGGMAVELAGYPTGTEGVDFAVTMREFERTMRKLEADPRFRNVESLGTIGGAEFFAGNRWIDVDFLNPTLFRGRKTGDEFMEYVRRYRSRSTTFGAVARPEVTWYMRLVIPDWEIYVQKILRDVRAGVPQRTLDGALAIATFLGVEQTVAPRIRKAREFLAKAMPPGESDRAGNIPSVVPFGRTGSQFGRLAGVEPQRRSYGTSGMPAAKEKSYSCFVLADSTRSQATTGDFFKLSMLWGFHMLRPARSSF